MLMKKGARFIRNQTVDGIVKGILATSLTTVVVLGGGQASFAV
ncbi:hypothetical protein PNH38_16950 [Anoxybacillus rupiensis]|uniref:Smalltalk protein n=1 Tax=Anoxybacteroides rupiense TaxID=311460 RepID=A0ABT5W892_9BACL|nr:hypothetical protein [Anoxybacillus rupiensis]